MKNWVYVLITVAVFIICGIWYILNYDSLSEYKDSTEYTTQIKG